MTAILPIASITVGDRHRKDFGDLAGLAQSIRAEGLLQPVGITPARELVFGERRLRACRDILHWTDIDVRVVDVSSIAAGEYHENEVRKDFTPSERVAITDAVRAEIGNRQGQRTDLEPLQHVAEVERGETTRDAAARLTGFGTGETYRRAKAVVEHGTPELIAQMDSGVLSISAAARIAHYRTVGTGENEWYTPPEYVEPARACLGAIDVDPATSVEAQRTIRAAKFFTAEDDGLQQEWHGRVWLNPPYAQPLIAHFITKLLAEVDAGHTTEAVVLTHNYTDTAWFQAAAVKCTAICFTRGCVRFVNTAGERAAPTQGQAFFYFGPRIKAFRARFGDLGFIAPSERWRWR